MPAVMVSLTGIQQGLGAVGLLVPATRGLADLCLALLLVAMLPANVSAPRKGVPMRGRTPTPLWLRIPMQLLFVGLTLWATSSSPIRSRKGGPTQDRRSSSSRAPSSGRKAVARDNDVSVTAASTVQQSIGSGLLDEIVTNLAPVLLGDGVGLFGVEHPQVAR